MSKRYSFCEETTSGGYIWPDVPVMYEDCTTVEQRLKMIIRRAAEKANDSCIYGDDLAEFMFERLLYVPEFRDLVEAKPKPSLSAWKPS